MEGPEQRLLAGREAEVDQLDASFDGPVDGPDEGVATAPEVGPEDADGD